MRPPRLILSVRPFSLSKNRMNKLRVSIQAVLWLLLPMLLTSCGTTEPNVLVPPESDPRFSAVVSESEAQFTLPLPDRAVWEWNRGGVPDDALEYHWVVRVANAGKEYDFGFLHFKVPGKPRGSGSLQDLLAAGQASVAVASGAQRALIEDARIEVTPKGDHLLIRVSDPRTLTLLFSQRPRHAVFDLRTPYHTPTQRSISIVYR